MPLVKYYERMKVWILRNSMADLNSIAYFQRLQGHIPLSIKIRIFAASTEIWCIIIVGISLYSIWLAEAAYIWSEFNVYIKSNVKHLQRPHLTTS